MKLYLHVHNIPVPHNNGTCHFYAIDTAFYKMKYTKRGIHQEYTKYRPKKMASLIKKDNSILVQGHISNLHKFKPHTDKCEICFLFVHLTIFSPQPPKRKRGGGRGKRGEIVLAPREEVPPTCMTGATSLNTDGEVPYSLIEIFQLTCFCFLPPYHRSAKDGTTPKWRKRGLR